MGVDSHEERSDDALALAIVADRLRDCQHMPFVERNIESRSTMTRSTEGNALRSHCGIGALGKIRCHQFVSVNEAGTRGRLPGELADMRTHDGFVLCLCWRNCSRAAASTCSTSKPNCSCATSPGADNPKLRMAMIAPY